MTVRRVLPADVDISEGWWADWWVRDYSWAGLADRPWYRWQVGADGLCSPVHAGTPIKQATLQDYWRRGPGSGREHDTRTDEEIEREMLVSNELVTGPNEELWHVLHLPLRWKDGTLTLKSRWADEDWGRTAALLSARLLPKKDITARFGEIAGDADTRANFSGIIVDSILKSTDLPVGIKADYSAILHELDWQEGLVDDNLNFNHAFIYYADFSGATFCKGRDEQYSSFSWATISSRSYFVNTAYETQVEFIGTIFAEYPDFTSARFNGPCYFRGANFVEGAWFWNVVFAKNVSFTNSLWGSGGSFGAAEFIGTPAFEGAQLHQDITFDAAKFIAVDRALKKAQLRFYTALALAVVCGYLSFLAFVEGGARPWPTAIFLWLVGVILVIGWGVFSWATLVWFIFGGAHGARNADEKAVGEGDANLERWTRAYRTLAVLTDSVGNKRDAARFHRLELRASRLRAGVTLKEIFVSKPVEKTLSALFDIASGYGESIVRPVIFLCLVILLFAKIFMYMGGSPPNPSTSIISAEAISYSAGRAFPFGAWGEAEDKKVCSLRMRLFAMQTERGELCLPERSRAGGSTNPDSLRLKVAALGTLESVMSAVLIFLAGLGVRRKFRIS
jgi:hypothetical protein